MTVQRGKFKQQLNKNLIKNNKGATLVTVLLVASVVAILVMAVLAIVLLNVFMKTADQRGQVAFYDAESALEENRAGLAVQESKATTTAYLDTLANYNSESSEGEDARTKQFQKVFREDLRDRLTIKGNEGQYDISKLESYLKGTAQDGGGVMNENGGIAKVVTVADDAGFSAPPNGEGVTLYNVEVQYTDEDGYQSQIKTDIVLEYPDVNYQNASSTDNILTYGLIANEHFQPGGSNTITGNAYIGGDEDGTDNESAAYFSNANGVTFKPKGTQETNVICGGIVNLNNSGSSASPVLFDNVNLWCQNLKLQDSVFNMDAGTTYIRDDIELKRGGNASLSGKLIMFGNPWVAISDMVTSSEVINAAKADMPAYSSSILVTGSNSKIDLSGLTTMVIGGSAYIDTESNQGSSSTIGKANEKVVMGQSMALKSDQRAYLVPTALVGAGLKSDGSNYKNGLSNPMSASQFTDLRTEIAKEYYGGTESKVQLRDYVNFDLSEPTIGESLYRFYYNFLATRNSDLELLLSTVNLSDWDKLARQDVINGTSTYDNAISTYKAGHDYYENTIKANPRAEIDDSYLAAYILYEYIQNRPTVALNAYQTSNSKPLVYMFIQFNTIGENFSGAQNTTYIPAEALYNEWYRVYNSTADNKNRLRNNLEYYTPGTDGIQLPSNPYDTKNMYFTGNILSTNASDVIINDSITRDDFTMELNVEYSRQSAYYQDAFYTLNKNLSMRYSTLASEQKSKELFDNIVDKSSITSTYEYVSTSGEGAVVTNGDFDYNSTNENSMRTVEDANGDTHSDAVINVIIAKGNVTVSQDFTGMIIAGGDIIVKSGYDVTNDSGKASIALQAVNNDYSDDKVCAAKFIWDASKYLTGGSASEDESTGSLSMKDYITFRNWTRV